MAFHPEYVRLVLNENFEDAKRLFLDPLMAIQYAHLAMLAETDIVGRPEARRLRSALDAIDLDRVRTTPYDGECEDLFFYLERLIVQSCGADTAGHLHTARSRNDIDMTMYRMRLREQLLDLAGEALAVRRALTTLAAAHRETIFPAHTHTQPAQPTTVAHYLLAFIEELTRDHVRIVAAFETTNRNPLGACAITGTGFPIDRRRTSELLGFSGPTGNTYGSIATVDYVLESAAAAAVTLVGLGRFVQDMLLWCTSEVGYLRLADPLVQSSSIMPQKRNPVALEHARSIASKALAQASSMALVVHNTPFGDVVDTEDDFQPLVDGALRDATRALALVAVAMADAELDTAKMAGRAAEHWVTITELADTLARDHGVPFRAGHAIAARLVHTRGSSGSLSRLLAAASKELVGHEITIADDALARILSPQHFIDIRRTHGGPAPGVIARALADADAAFERDAAAIAERRRAIAAATTSRRAAVDSI